MRRLLIFTIAYSVTTFLLTVIQKPVLWNYCCVVCCFGALLFLLLRNRRTAFHRLFLIFLGIALSVASFQWHSRTVTEPCQQLDGVTREMTLLVTDYPETGDEYKRVEVKPEAHDLPNSTILLYDNSFQYDLNELQPGDILSCSVKLKSSNQRYGKTYYGLYSTGVYLTGTIRSAYHIVGHKSDILSDICFLPVRIRHAVLKTADAVFAPSIRPFMKSLLLNARHEFYADSDLSTSMSRAGIMHIVAVSGMHIAFLVGFLKLLFGNGKSSSLLCLFLVWFFVLLSGAPVSAVRAGFMQSMILSAVLFERENDPPTSLCFALFVIVFLNPWAVRSVSLQLSFGAVLGLILFSGNIYASLTRNCPKPSKKLSSKLQRYLAATISSSIGVMIITIPLCAYHFGTIQLLSIVTNILVLWAVSLCFGGGFLAVAAARFIPVLMPVFAVPTAWLARYITGVAEAIAGLRYSVLYCNNADSGSVIFIAAVYFLFILFHFLPLPERRRITVPALLSFVLFCILITGTKLKYDLCGYAFNVINIGQGQCIAVYSGDKTLMIDCGSTMTSDNAGDVAGKYLQSCQRFKVDQLILTHLHEDHANGVETLLQYVDIGEILVSADLISDTDLLPVIKTAAKEHGTALTFIEKDTVYSLGNCTVHLYRSNFDNSDENETCLLCLVSVDGYDMLVTADLTQQAEAAFLKRVELPTIDLLVLGHHGSRYAACEELLHTCSGADGVISVGYNTYGHPAQETLDRASEYLPHVYRTDTDGTVQFIHWNGKYISWLKNHLKTATIGTK